MTDKQTALEPCGWQFFQDGKWHNGMATNNHRSNTEAAGIPVRDVYPGPAQQVEIPADVVEAAQLMQDGDYRGPPFLARKVFDWVAAHGATKGGAA